MRILLVVLVFLCLCIPIFDLPSETNKHVQYVEFVEKGFRALFQGDNQATIDAFNDALAIEPNHHEILHYLGMIYAEDSSWIKAVEVYSRSLEIQPDNIEVLYSLGVVYFKLNQWADALTPLQKAVSLSPQHARGYEVLGKVHVKLRQYTNAVEVLNKAIALKPNAAGNYNELGNAYLNLKDYEDAIINYKKAIEIGPPDFAEPHFGLGTAYLRTGKQQKSREEMQIYQTMQKVAADHERFTRLTRVDPNNLEGWVGLAKVLMQQRKYKRVIPVFQKCIELAKAQNASAATIAGFHHGLSQTFINLKYPKLAVDSAKTAIELVPKHDLFYNTLGSAYAMLGEVENAIAVFQKAVSLNEEHPYYHLNLSKLYESIGQQKLAKQHYQAYQHFLSIQKKQQK